MPITSRKKQRGASRKLKKLFEYIEAISPYAETDDRFENFLVPSDPFLNTSRVSGKIKTAFCRKWLEAAERILREKPKDIPFCKVVACLDLPYLWDSQIIIFYDEEYYRDFWERNTRCQKWVPIENAKSLIKTRNFSTVLYEKGYTQIICDEDETYRSELWFYGELPFENEVLS